jgi:hypothetical protein
LFRYADATGSAPKMVRERTKSRPPWLLRRWPEQADVFALATQEGLMWVSRQLHSGAARLPAGPRDEGGSVKPPAVRQAVHLLLGR